jgi:hypothetical protein
VTRQLGWCVGISLTFWLALAYPAWRLGGNEALGYTATGELLCLVPTVAALGVASWLRKQAPQLTVPIVLAGSALRMALVLGCGVAISLLGLPGLPQVDVVAFWLWLLVFYLFHLALEVALLVAGGRG